MKTMILNEVGQIEENPLHKSLRKGKIYWQFRWQISGIVAAMSLPGARDTRSWLRNWVLSGQEKQRIILLKEGKINGAGVLKI